MRTMLASLILSVLAPFAWAGNRDVEREVSAYLEELPDCEATMSLLAVDEESWTFDLAVYLWAAGIDGTLGARGVTVPVDVGFDKLFDQLDGALMLHGTARKGRWGLFVDIAYISLDVDTTGPLGQPASADSEIFFGEIAATYAALETEIDEEARLLIDVYAGLRIYATDTSITLALGGGSQDDSWVDPIVGFDAVVLTGKWRFGTRADIGGFGAGSDLSWSILVGAQYRFTDLFSMALGYRWLDIDRTKGSGTGAFTFDATLSGPVVAFVFSF